MVPMPVTIVAKSTAVVTAVTAVASILSSSQLTDSLYKSSRPYGREPERDKTEKPRTYRPGD